MTFEQYNIDHLTTTMTTMTYKGDTYEIQRTEQPSLTTDTLDGLTNSHAWCVDKDKNIIEPSPIDNFWEMPIYILGLDKDRPVYEEFDLPKQKAMLTHYVKEWGGKPKWFKKLCKTQPQFGNCHYNAIGNKINDPSCKIRFGKMGYKYKNSEDVYWEWGDTDRALFTQDQETYQRKTILLLRRKDKGLIKILRNSNDPQAQTLLDAMARMR